MLLTDKQTNKPMPMKTLPSRKSIKQKKEEEERDKQGDENGQKKSQKCSLP